MKYQLVLQWPASSITDLDILVELEDALIEGLARSEVDGHDIGSGEANIFIHTDDAAQTFKKVKTVLEGREAWTDIRIAYREIAGDRYTVLWPEDLTNFNVW